MSDTKSTAPATVVTGDDIEEWRIRLANVNGKLDGLFSERGRLCRAISGWEDMRTLKIRDEAQRLELEE